MTDTLINLYKEMSELTSPECGACPVPHSCCDKLACDMATAYAAELGVTLTPTGHDKLPYMGENGCVVPPHLRPICTLHTCAVNSLGFKRGDEAWSKKYHELRDRIEALEWKRHFNRTLAHAITSARQASGQTQQQIADKLGYHVNHVQRFESGKHKLSAYDVVRLARAIGVPTSELLP